MVPSSYSTVIKPFSRAPVAAGETMLTTLITLGVRKTRGISSVPLPPLLAFTSCCYGCVSPFVKAVQDRAISYVHPDFILREGRMHHKRRYQNRIAISAWFYGEDVTEAEKETARNLIQANNENYGGRVAEVLFFDTPEQMGGMTL